MAWSHSKIRPVHRKDDYARLRCKPLFGNSPFSIRAFASLRQGCPLQTLPITMAAQLCVGTWSIYPRIRVHSCSEALKALVKPRLLSLLQALDPEFDDFSRPTSRTSATL